MHYSAILTLFVGAVVVVTIPGTACGSELRTVAADVISGDKRNAGIKVALVEGPGGVLTFDLKGIKNDKSPMDVFRVLLSVAEKLEDKSFSRVTLAYRGNGRFVLPGKHFQTLGKEFGTQNPMYLIRTFPEKLLTVDGKPAFPKRSGGLLYVARVQMSDFASFNDSWFLKDVRAEYEAEIARELPTSYDDDDAL